MSSAGQKHAPAQVHEKSILLPLLPLTLLAHADGAQRSDARVAAWAQLLAPFSMYPLLKKDGLTLAYLGTTAFYWAATVLAPAAADGLLATEAGGAQRQAQQTRGGGGARRRDWPAAVELLLRRGPAVSLAGCLALQAGEALAPPPERYPFLWDAAITSWAFLHFAALFAYTNAQQWREYRRAAPPRGGKAKRV